MPKKQRIYVDEGIEELVKSLNQIEGIETCVSCEGHRNRPISVGMGCTIEAAVSLMKLALKRPGVSFQVRVGHRPSREHAIVRATLRIGSLPHLREKKHELKEAFLNDLRDSGLMTQGFKGKVLTHEWSKPFISKLREKEASESEPVAKMTPSKFKLLCEFVCEKWKEEAEFLYSRSSKAFFHTSTERLPTLSGDVNNGNFSYEPDWRNLWNIEWEERRIRMYLILGGSHYYANCLEDAERARIPHVQGEAARILRQILAD